MFHSFSKASKFTGDARRIYKLTNHLGWLVNREIWKMNVYHHTVLRNLH